ncbi:hypothetical protein ABPG75_012126 [Micractinium tetrahymenae]
MDLQSGGHDLPELEMQLGADWCMEDLEWDVVRMSATAAAAASASPTTTKSSGGGRKGGPSTLRSANTCCQVEGCNQQLLPLRSYYQRQHICEEHFRALAISDASGRLSRFCQQCTKLEALECFDGERRSCRASLERRNLRRHGKRTSGAGGKARRSGSKSSSAGVKKASCKKAATAASAPNTHSGSGSGGSTTAAPQQLNSPSLQLTQSSGAQAEDLGARLESAMRAEVAAALREAAAARNHGAGSAGWAQHAPGPSLAAYYVATSAEQQQHHQQYGMAGPPPSIVSAATALGASRPRGPAAMADLRLLPLGELPLGLADKDTDGGAGHGLAALDVDDLLAMDAGGAGQGLRPRTAALQPGQAAGGGAAAAVPAERALQHMPHADAAWLQPFADEPELASVGRLPLLSLFPSGAAPQAAQQQQQQQQQQRGGGDLAWRGAGSWDLRPATLPGAAAAGPAATQAPPSALPGEALRAQLAQRESEIQGLLARLAPGPEEVRVSLKIYGVRPEQLPADLRCDLLTALQLPGTHVEASIRAGCVHLTLNALVSPEERQRLAAPGAAAAVAARLTPLLEALPGPGRLAVQLGGASGGASAALLARQGGGWPALLLGLRATADVLPPCIELAAGAPQATTVSAAGGRFRLLCPRALLSGGASLGLHCRSGGRHMGVGLSLAGAEAPAPPGSDAGSHGTSDEEEAFSGSEEEAEALGEEEEEEEEAIVEAVAWVPAAAPPGGSDGGSGSGGNWQAGWGLYELEIARGTLLGTALPLLVLPDSQAAAAAELARMPAGPAAGSVLRLTSAVLRYLQQRGGATGTAAAAAFEAAYPPLAVARLAAAARSLVELADRAGWPATARLLRPAMGADGHHPAHAAAQQQPARPARQSEQQPEVVATLLPAVTPSPAAAAAAGLPLRHASGSSGKPAKSPPSPPAAGTPGGSGKGGGGGKLSADEASLSLGTVFADLDGRDRLRRVMHPAVLGAVTLVMAGLVLGVGAAMVAGHLS